MKTDRKQGEGKFRPSCNYMLKICEDASFRLDDFRTSTEELIDRPFPVVLIGRSRNLQSGQVVPSIQIVTRIQLYSDRYLSSVST